MKYENAERLCECWKCEESYGNGGSCSMSDKYQRHPEDLAHGALGLCPKLQKDKMQEGE